MIIMIRFPILTWAPPLRKRFGRLLAPFAVFVCFSQAIPAQGAQALKKAVFIPQWSPQAQFAGFYVGRQMGYYKQQGIDLTILQGGPDSPSSRMLREKRVDFTTMFLSTAVKLRSQGVPVVNVAQIVQRSALMLVTRKGSGITRPEDFQDRKVSIWPGFRLQVMAFFDKYRVRVKEIPQGYSVNLFLRGAVDAASAMWYNEYKTILDSGINENELTTFMLSDYGINFPEDGIYCLASVRKKDPALVRGFVQATIKGWRYAFDHPDQALDIVMHYVNEAHLPTNRIHQKWMLEHMRMIIRPPGGNIPMGRLSRGSYQFVAQTLMHDGIIRNIPKFKEFYEPTEP